MALYLISYDLLHHKTFGDYEELIGELERLGARHVLLSQWTLRTDDTAVGLRDSLKAFVHTDDRLLVCVMGTWAGRHLMADINEV